MIDSLRMNIPLPSLSYFRPSIDSYVSVGTSLLPPLAAKKNEQFSAEKKWLKVTFFGGRVSDFGVAEGVLPTRSEGFRDRPWPRTVQGYPIQDPSEVQHTVKISSYHAPRCWEKKVY